MTLIIGKILFLIVLVLMSMSLLTWTLKNKTGWLRKPLVLILFIPTYLPRVLIGLVSGEAYRIKFWKELNSNLKVAWKGHI